MFYSPRHDACRILSELRNHGCSDKTILDYIIETNLPSHVALQALLDYRDEFLESGEESV